MAASPSPTDRSLPDSDVDDPALSPRRSAPCLPGFRRLESVIPKPEIFTWCGCLIMFQLLGAAAVSGYVITALFLFVAIGRLVRNVLQTLTARLPKRSALKHYTMAVVSLMFFCLLVIRMCFIATVIIDSAIGGDNVKISGDPQSRF